MLGDVWDETGGRVIDGSREAGRRTGNWAQDAGEATGDAAQDSVSSLNDAGSYLTSWATGITDDPGLQNWQDELDEFTDDTPGLSSIRDFGETTGEVAQDPIGTLDDVTDDTPGLSQIRDLGEATGEVAQDPTSAVDDFTDDTPGLSQIRDLGEVTGDAVQDPVGTLDDVTDDTPGLSQIRDLGEATGDAGQTVADAGGTLWDAADPGGALKTSFWDLPFEAGQSTGEDLQAGMDWLTGGSDNDEPGPDTPGGSGGVQFVQHGSLSPAPGEGRDRGATVFRAEDAETGDTRGYAAIVGTDGPHVQMLDDDGNVVTSHVRELEFNNLIAAGRRVD